MALRTIAQAQDVRQMLNNALVKGISKSIDDAMVELIQEITLEVAQFPDELHTETNEEMNSMPVKTQMGLFNDRP